MTKTQNSTARIIKGTFPFMPSCTIAVNAETPMIVMTISSTTHPIPFTETSDAL